MSTRANIIVTDGEDELIFYRHCDGYPDGTLPSLTKFLGLAREGIIRDNVVQACGWLILIGASEDGICDQDGVVKLRSGHLPGWKVGAYEPTTSIHGDIEFLYLVDLKKQQLAYRKVIRDAGQNVVVPHSFYSGCFNPTRDRSSGRDRVAPINRSCRGE